MLERTLHDLLPDLFAQPLGAIRTWAARQKLTREETTTLYRSLAKRNQLEEWKIKVQLACYLFALSGWTEEELRSENRQIFEAFGGRISFGREPDGTAYEIPYKILWPKIIELFRRIHHFPSSFFETEATTHELLERLFRETEPDTEEFVDLARGIADRSKKRQARAVA